MAPHKYDYEDEGINLTEDELRRVQTMLQRLPSKKTLQQIKQASSRELQVKLISAEHELDAYLSRSTYDNPRRSTNIAYSKRLIRLIENEMEQRRLKE